jgi:hypothetical protein
MPLTGMHAARVEGLSFPYRPLRRIFGPGSAWTVLTGALATLREMALRPSLPRMSAQWLQSHEKEFNRVDY